MAFPQIPLDDVGEGIRAALWAALSGSLGIITCEQCLYAASADEDELGIILPLIRIYQGGCVGAGDMDGFRWRGSAEFVIVYNVLFPQALSDYQRSRSLTQAAQQIAQVFTTLVGNVWKIPGYTPPPGIFITRACSSGIRTAPSAELECDEVNMGVANVSVTVDLVVTYPDA